MNLVDVDTVLLGGWWINFGQSFYEMLESRLKEQVLGVSDMQVSVSMPPVADHPALYGAAEVGLRRFIDNPLDSSPTKREISTSAGLARIHWT